MSTRGIWLNYNNDQKKYRIPVNPEKITISVDGKLTSSDIDSFGEILHKGKRGAMTISWNSFFPSSYGRYCSCDRKNYNSANTMHNWIMALMNAEKPVHFVVTGGPFPLNIYAVIKSYKPYEQGGDPGTIYYAIELREYRGIKITSYSKNKKTVSKKRVSNKTHPNTYKIKKKDTLWKIAKKYYGSGKKRTKIFTANKSKLDKVARKHGKKSSNNGRILYAGTKIKLP